MVPGLAVSLPRANVVAATIVAAAREAGDHRNRAINPVRQVNYRREFRRAAETGSSTHVYANFEGSQFRLLTSITVTFSLTKRQTGEVKPILTDVRRQRRLHARQDR